MSSAIDFRTLPPNVPVMCIPRVFPNINEGRIRRIFDELNMGEIERVDIVGKSTEKGEKFNRVFVHFRKWFSNKNADTARERLINGKEIKIIYDEPWFWKVSAYREVTRTARPQQQPAQRKPPSLQFDDEKPPAPRVDEFGRNIPRPNNRFNNKRQPAIAPAIAPAQQQPIHIKKRNLEPKKPAAAKKVLEEGEIEE
jgi:hypothetical protein